MSKFNLPRYIKAKVDNRYDAADMAARATVARKREVAEVKLSNRDIFDALSVYRQFVKDYGKK